MRSSLAGKRLWLLAGLLGLAAGPLWAAGYEKGVFDGYAQKVEDTMDQAVSYYGFMRDIAIGAKAESATPENAAYAALDKPLADFGAAVESARADADKVGQVHAQIDDLYGTDRVISPNDSRWAQLNTLKDALQKAGDAYQAHGGAINGALHHYEDTANNSGVGGLIVADLMKTLDEKIANRKATLAEFRDMGQKIQALQLTGKDADRAAKIESHLESYEAEWEDCQTLFAKLQKECEGRKYLFSGPGIPPITEPDDIKDDLSKMKQDFEISQQRWEKIDKNTPDDGGQDH